MVGSPPCQKKLITCSGVSLIWMDVAPQQVPHRIDEMPWLVNRDARVCSSDATRLKSAFEIPILYVPSITCGTRSLLRRHNQQSLAESCQSVVALARTQRGRTPVRQRGRQNV